MGLSYFVWGKLEEASTSSRKAIELAPEDFVAHWTLGRIHFTNGEFAEAYPLFRRVIELKPMFATAHMDLAMTCDGLGRPEEARVARDRVLELLPNYLLQNPDDSRARMLHAIVLAGINRKDEALREGDKALETSPDDPLILYNCACLYARLGESQRAIEALRQGISKGYEDYGWMRNDPDLASLRDNPDFIGLTRGA
jgi:Flp pilus assembly protein TadD